jgi:hypothetical protein
MADRYQVAQGFDNTGGLADIATTHDPKCPGISDGELFWAGDGLEYEEGYREADLVWGFLTLADMDAFMDQVGLNSTTKSVEITIRMPTNFGRAMTNFNAVISRPSFPDDTYYAGAGKYGETVFRLSSVREIA